MAPVLLKNILLIITLSLSGYSYKLPTEELILNYDYFGPQAMAYEIIGNDWFQWLAHSEPRTKKYSIKVIIYNEVTLNAIANKYPIN